MKNPAIKPVTKSSFVNAGHFRRRPLWVGLKGSVIMVMTAPDVWEADFFLDYKKDEYRRFVCATGSYAFARLPTTEEREAIKENQCKN